MIHSAGSESKSEARVSAPSRVLIIDGDDIDRRLIQRLIGDHFEVSEAGDGREGLAVYQADSPDCVLLDLELSDSSGTDVFGNLVRQGATVVLLTGSDDAEHALEAVRQGAQDFLNKNALNEVMLRRVIRYAIERDRLKRELHRSVSDLRESERRFSELAEHIHHGLWIWTADSSQCLYQNPASDRIYGRTLEELNRIDRFDVIHPDDRAKEKERAQWSKGTKKEYESRFRVVHADGTVRHVEQSSFPLLDDNGEIARVIGICRDVTERQTLEAELRLAQKLEAVGQLAAGVAHEINTPSQYVSDNVAFLADSFDDLAPILTGYRELIELARAQGVSAEALGDHEQRIEHADVDYLLEELPLALNQSKDGLNQIKKIVRAMKDFSHPGDEMEAVDINQAIQSTVTVARNEWKYVAEVELDLYADLPKVICVPSAFNQVILNLIVNSAHAIGDVAQAQERNEKGRIRIMTSVRGNTAIIEVEDSGCGMPEDIRKKVFDPFFTTKEVGKGTGQGLAIAHRVITERHNGTISVRSEPGVGTRFTICLPVDGEEIECDGRAA